MTSAMYKGRHSLTMPEEGFFFCSLRRFSAEASISPEVSGKYCISKALFPVEIEKYLDEKRSFGGVLDNAQTRLEYYHLTLDRSIAAAHAGSSFCAGAACQ